MARATVIGGGLAGLASAARLAKQGHEVTLFEASARVGGALGGIEREGFAWDAGAAHTLLPAALRDLFRKTGRPLERELDLMPVEPAQRHRFGDGTVLDLPTGSRSGQFAAIEAALGPGAGQAWLDHTQEFAEAWDDLRRDWLERPYDPQDAAPRTKRLLAGGYSLHKIVRQSLKDVRLRALALSWARLEGHDPRDVPAWAGLESYVAQNFGTWTLSGGMRALVPALESRLATRGVQVHTGTEILDLVLDHGRVAGVRTAAGDSRADIVVVAVDPRRVPTLAPLVAKTMPALPPVVTHLGLTDQAPDLPHELVLHGDPTLWVRTGGTAPEGHRAWTVLGRGKVSDDLVADLFRAGLDVRGHVQVAIRRSPRDQVLEGGGSAYGVLWQGRRTVERRLGPSTPVPGVYCAGAHATPGAGVAYAALSASLVAQLVGKAERQTASESPA